MGMRMLFGAATVAGSLVVSASAWAQGKQDFTLVNKTGYILSELYVSPAAAQDWEYYVLGKDVLGDGEALDISFNRTVKTCKWDLKVVYEDDDSSAVWSGIDLCTVSRITIKYNRSTDTTSATFD